MRPCACEMTMVTAFAPRQCVCARQDAGGRAHSPTGMSADSGLSSAALARLQRPLSDSERLRLLTKAEATDLHTIQQLFDANDSGGFLTPKPLLKTSSSSQDAEASFQHARSLVVTTRPGLIPFNKEAAFCEQLTAAHAAGHVTFSREDCGHVADQIDIFTSELADAEQYPVVAVVFARARTALASSSHMRPFSGKKEETLTTLARSLHGARHSTPGQPQHFDNCTLSHFPGACTAPRQPGLHLGLRLLITLECANVTHVRDPRGRWEYSVQAPCAGAGVGMPSELRGYIEDGPTRYLHAGGAHFLDGTPLPARLQLLMNFSVFDEPAWNATMDAFRLQDMVDAASAGELDLRDPAIAAMVAPLAAAVRARAA